MPTREEREQKKAEKLEKIKAAAKEYLEDPQIKVDELSAKYGIPTRTLFHYFKELGVHRDKSKQAVAERKIRETEIQALTQEAEKIATLAIGIGGVIARRYLPLIEHLMAGGKTLEMIAEDVMGWYEMKIPTETNITKLNTEIQMLNERLAEAYVMALPNFRYMLRANLVTDYAKHLLVARMRGLRIPVRATLRALQNDLNAIDTDLKELIVA